MKAYGEVYVQIHIFFTSALVGGEWQLHAPAALHPEKEPRVPIVIGGWVGPRAGLDDVEKRKFLNVLGVDLRPLGHPARSQSLLYRLRYSGS
jgi:hypothetical protein